MFKNIAETYDYIFSSILTGDNVLYNENSTDSNRIYIDSNSTRSKAFVKVYLQICALPNIVDKTLLSNIRGIANSNGVLCNIEMDIKPYQIDWGSPEMNNRMRNWERYTNEVGTNHSVFRANDEIKDIKRREEMIKSTRYMFDTDQKYGRTFELVAITIELVCRNVRLEIIKLNKARAKIFNICKSRKIEIREVKYDLPNFIRAYNCNSINYTDEYYKTVPKLLLSDDIISSLTTVRQGIFGDEGVIIGKDVKNEEIICKKMKRDEKDPENWIIAGETGSGKSNMVKSICNCALSMGYKEIIMDYEGDEYRNFANYINADNNDAVIISMGRGSNKYFDPCQIMDLTGDERIDSELKQSATDFTLRILEVIVEGKGRKAISNEQRKIISLAIKRAYESVGVTENRETWKFSKKLLLNDIYFEIKEMKINKEFVGIEDDGKNEALNSIYDALSIYFEEGEAKYGAFGESIDITKIRDKKLIIFSFGAKGEVAELSDSVVLNVKQLSAAYLGTMLSNYNFYVLDLCTIKVWEEFQRWSTLTGSEGIIINAITGGRKRGDINFILTNNLSQLLDENNITMKGIKDNINNLLIGAIKSKDTINDFCRIYNLDNCKKQLLRIRESNSAKKKSHGMGRYKYAFLFCADNGKKAILKAVVNRNVLESGVFNIKKGNV